MRLCVCVCGERFLSANEELNVQRTVRPAARCAIHDQVCSARDPREHTFYRLHHYHHHHHYYCDHHTAEHISAAVRGFWLAPDTQAIKTIACSNSNEQHRLQDVQINREQKTE